MKFKAILIRKNIRFEKNSMNFHGLTKLLVRATFSFKWIMKSSSSKQPKVTPLNSLINSFINLEDFRQKIDHVNKIYASMPRINRDESLKIEFKTLILNLLTIQNQSPANNSFLHLTKSMMSHLADSQTKHQILLIYLKTISDLIQDGSLDTSLIPELSLVLSQSIRKCDIQFFASQFNEKLLIDLFLQRLNYMDSLKNSKEALIPILRKVFLNCSDRKQSEEILRISAKIMKGKTLKTLLKLKNWEFEEFPFLKKQAKKGLFSFKFRECVSYWELEEFYEDDPEMLFRLVRKLYKKEKNMAFSIFYRHFSKGKKFERETPKPFLREGVDYKYLENPLQRKDDFKPMEVILSEDKINIIPSKKQELAKDLEYLSLNSFGIRRVDVTIIDSLSNLKSNAQEIISSPVIGLDTESVVQNGEMSILQISTSAKKIYLIDIFAIGTENYLWNIISTLFSNNSIKVCQNISSEIRSLKNFSANLIIKPKNLVDIGTLFKSRFPSETKSSLSHMVEALFSRRLSKQEQTGNWKRRPLRNYEIHYAALDSYLMIELYNILKHATFQKH